MIQRKKDSEILDDIKMRMAKRGTGSLTDEELIALIIKKGSGSMNVTELSRMLLRHCDGLKNIYDMPADIIISQNKGMTQAKVMALKVMIETGIRYFHKRTHDLKMDSPKSVYEYLSVRMKNLTQEYFKVILLNTKNEMINVEDITVGLINSSLVHAREIFRCAILKNAYSVILAHNHPSGDPTPSGNDREVTDKIVEAGKILGIKVCDHIIIGNDSYYSFLEKGMID